MLLALQLRKTNFLVKPEAGGEYGEIPTREWTELNQWTDFANSALGKLVYRAVPSDLVTKWLERDGRQKAFAEIVHFRRRTGAIIARVSSCVIPPY